MNKSEKKYESNEDQFAQINDKELSLFREFFLFLKEHKKMWLLPFVFLLLVMGALIMLSGSSAASFMYTLF